jgi:hypothetical protein
LLGAEFEGAADDQGHSHRTGIHHQDVLEAQSGELATGQFLVDGVNG